MKKNEALIGCTERVMIDLHSEDGVSIGRTYRDAPEVDNFVRIDGSLPIGEFIDVIITEASEYDIKGEVLAFESETV